MLTHGQRLPLLFFALLMAGCAADSATDVVSPIPAVELDRRGVMGRLGAPLGTSIEIEATVVSGDDLRAKSYASKYLLSVVRVDGRILPAPELIEFEVPSFASVRLANHVFDLYELKTGEPARPLDSTLIDELEEGYVGKTVRLGGYESGSYHGIPSPLPDPVMPWADVGFQFSTYFVALIERE